MNVSRHTEGPWRVNVDGCGDTFISGPNGEYLADLGASSDEQEQLRADAHLLAASPCLLAEAETDLQAWENVLELGLMPEQHRDTVLARIGRLPTVIVKAKGGKQ